MPHDPYKALYLHLPFCVKRCGYCDFATEAMAADDARIDAYVEDLCLQIRRKAREGELGALETVYLGGGTPSHVGLSRLSMLLYTLSLSMRLEPDVECTMEANPESLGFPGSRCMGVGGESALHRRAELRRCGAGRARSCARRRRRAARSGGGADAL